MFLYVQNLSLNYFTHILKIYIIEEDNAILFTILSLLDINMFIVITNINEKYNILNFAASD